MSEQRYTGQPDAMIAEATDPWLQVAGEPVDLTQFDSSDFPAGVFAPVNDNYGIERLDELDFYDSDFAAAEALAEYLHVKTGLDYEVWYEADDEPALDS